MFRSTNGGRTWTFAGAGLGREPLVTGLAVDAVQPGTVYAATEAGLFRTTNGGDSWVPLKLPAQLASLGAAVAADPRRSGIVYASLADGGMLASSNRERTWRTLDLPQDESAGSSWAARVAF